MASVGVDAADFEAIEPVLMDSSSSSSSSGGSGGAGGGEGGSSEGGSSGATTTSDAEALANNAGVDSALVQRLRRLATDFMQPTHETRAAQERRAALRDAEALVSSAESEEDEEAAR
jgi:hypothetical protein